MIFVDELKRLFELGTTFVYNFIYLRNWIYHVYIYVYSNNLSEKISGNFHETLDRLYHFLSANLTLTTSHTTLIVLIITQIIIPTCLNRRPIIRLRLIFELLQ
jgi:hypothetical protein